MYNIGITGTGFISSDFINAARLDNRANPYAICSRNIETATRFKAEHNLEVAYTDYSAMINDSSIDIIYIASPNGLHFEHAKDAIKAGKHCLIEKPISLRPAEINELYKLAKKHNVFIMEAYVSLTYNTFNKVKEWIDTLGEIGKVDFHLDQQTRHFHAYLEGQDFNVFNGKMGGGALRDLGPYTLYPLISWFGEPMQSHYFSTKNELGADETTLVLCHYQTFSSTIHVSKMLTDKRPNLISGDNGYIEIDHINAMQSIKLFDPKGNLLEEVKSEYENRMTPQVNHYLDIIESGKFESKIYTQELAEQVHLTISENYK
ncbi:Gfo/Idh/MocA family oxidoreductase [Mollicutes bacterium LVI A0078]|nr:Gfo/Idh/MocA family oxidoreductase [Mollicutes bacterium LVI A0075]WOO90066.1 Gfo/Idh/MocA family oxidoreductase [Mollicutes bacterium LVI A0078]